jgi:hypothetical protein
MFAACKCVVKIKVAAGVDVPDGLHFVVTASGGVCMYVPEEHSLIFMHECKISWLICLLTLM